MKLNIKEKANKTKQFVKNHKKEIIVGASATAIGVGICGIIREVYEFGFEHGESGGAISAVNQCLKSFGGVEDDPAFFDRMKENVADFNQLADGLYKITNVRVEDGHIKAGIGHNWDNIRELAGDK